MNRRLNIGNVLLSLLIMFIILIGTPIQSRADKPVRCPCFNINMLQGMSRAFDEIDCYHSDYIHYAHCYFYNVDLDDGAFFMGDGYKGQQCIFTIYGGGIDQELTSDEARECFEVVREFIEAQYQ